MGQIHPIISDQIFDSLYDSAIIRKGLSHPHKYDICEPIPLFHRSFHANHLIDNLSRRQIPVQSLFTGQTKPASHGATRLRGYTEGEVISFRDQDGFYELTICQCK